MKANFLNEKVLFIFVICASFVLTRSHSFWSEIPQGLHVWTQTDRLALAQRFGEERSQLIYPRTYNLKPNHHSNKISEDGITAVDFPLPEYVAGTLSRYTGQSVTLILRITYSLFFCIGLYLLYVQLRLHGLSFLRAYAVIGLIFTSPVVFYYSAGMLPSTVAFSFSLAGYAFVNLGKSRAQFSRVLQGLALLVLAGMIRTPYYLNLAIVLLFLFILPMVKGKAPSKRMMIGVFILIIPAVSWWIWNISLRNTFGSMFLGRPLIPNSFSEGFSFLVNSINTWKWDYVAYVHVIIAGIGVFVLLIRSFSVLIRDFYFQAACLSFVLGILYAFLMAKQFVHHDYYAIDAFAIPFFLMLICVFAKMDRLPKFLEGVLFFTALLFAGFHLHGKHAERSFIGSWDRTFHVNRAFLNSKQLLDSLSIPSNANMLVLDAYSTNGPLLLLNRKGFTIMNTSEDELRKSLKLPFDYIAIADKFLLSDVLQYSNEMQSQLFRLGGNGEVSIFQISNTSSSYYDLLGVIPLAIKVDSFMVEKNENGFNDPFKKEIIDMEGITYGPTFRDTIQLSGMYGLVLKSEIAQNEKWPDDVEWGFKVGDISFGFKPSEYAQASIKGTFEAFFPFSVDDVSTTVECFLYNPSMTKFHLKSVKISLHKRK